MIQRDNAGWLLIGIVIAALFMLAMNKASRAQHGHSHGHDEYRNWSSQKVANCCNEQDCSGVPDSDIRETANGTMLRIDGEWCPVLQMHFLTRGKSPDWSVAHACIRKHSTAPPCERLLCFNGKGLF